MSEQPPPSADQRPLNPTAATFAVLAALIFGAAAVAGVAFVESGAVRLLVAVVVVGVGCVVLRRTVDAHHPTTRGFGPPVLRGSGTSLVVLGAYLLGSALVAASVSDGFDGGSSSSVVLVLLVYGVPAVAVLAVATTGMRAWLAGGGVLVPTLVVLLMAIADATTAAVTVTMLAVALVLTVVVVRAPASSSWGHLASAAAATAASFAYGTGTSPLATLGATQLRTSGDGTVPDGGLAAGTQVLVVALTLLLATVLLVVAVARRDLAGGFLAGVILATSPAGTVLGVSVASDELWFALAGVPAFVAVVALVALRVPTVLDALLAVPVASRDRRPSGATAAAAAAVVVAAAAVGYVAQGMDLFLWRQEVRGAVALAVVLAVAALAYWLPGAAGAAGAVVALLGLHFASPFQLLLPPISQDPDPTTRVIGGVLTLVTSAAVGGALALRHRRPAVFAAAAYVLLAGIAAFVWSILAGPSFADLFSGDDAVAVVASPLVLVGAPAAVAALRGPTTAHGQAVGAVVLAAGGLLPLKVVLGMMTRGEAMRGLQMESALAPFTPTDWLGAAGAIREVGVPIVTALVAVVLLALVFAVSLVRRPSPPLAAAVALVLFSGVQTAVLLSLA